VTRPVRSSVALVAVVAAMAVLPSTTRAQSTDSTIAAATFSSWTADRRHFAVGDIITVLVDESTIASADRMNYDMQDRSGQNRLRGNVGTGGTSSGADVSLNTGSFADSEQRGQARRSDRFVTEISVRVVAIEDGVLKVEGSKSLVIDKHEQTLTLSGSVRPQDVTRNNVIDSWRLGDARIAYVSNGEMGKPKRSILGRIFGVIWP